MSNGMLVCFVCGAENDPSNRFCDQCGAQLSAEGVETMGETVSGSPPVARLTCAICGAMVLPGQVFCDNCGADLRVNTPVEEPYSGAPQPADIHGTHSASSADDPSTFVLPTQADSLTPDMEETMIASSLPDSMEGPVAAMDEETMAVPLPSEEGQLSEFHDVDDEDMQVPPPVAPPGNSSQPALEEEQTMVAAAIARARSMGTRDFGAPPPGPPGIEETPDPLEARTDTVSDERQRLDVEIEHHRKAIAQMEQMMQIYPQGSEPAYLAVALEDARRALTQAEFKLSELPDGPDMAEVARLEEEIEHHRKSIAQMEQMLKGFASGDEPTYLTVAVGDAYRALAQAESDLAALTRTQVSASAPSTVQAVPSVHSVAAAEPAAAAYTEETLIASPDQIPAPPASIGVAVPRLVLLEGGQELPLPTDKPEIIIGREDPVSNIYPEIDLTPFGGETGGVSRQHARIDHTSNQWTITDLNSTNYTRVNGNKLQPNVATPIENGTRLQFGRVALILKL